MARDGQYYSHPKFMAQQRIGLLHHVSRRASTARPGQVSRCSAESQLSRGDQVGRLEPAKAKKQMPKHSSASATLQTITTSRTERGRPLSRSPRIDFIHELRVRLVDVVPMRLA